VAVLAGELHTAGGTAVVVAAAAAAVVAVEVAML
jgi:hypothetical protein